MSARLITKCPECERVTGDCIDHGLEKDRTEFDGRRCRVCQRTTHANGLKASTKKKRLFGPIYYNATMTRARMTRGEFRPLI